MTKRTVVVALAVFALTALAASGCGESDEQKAQNRVCDARAGIASEVEALGGLTPSTVTADAVRDSVDSIRADLKAIGEARTDVGDGRRDDLQAANTAFAASIREVGASVLRSQSVEDARSQLTASLDTLAAAYRSTLGTFDCG
jgi:hypothetical protein